MVLGQQVKEADSMERKPLLDFSFLLLLLPLLLAIVQANVPTISGHLSAIPPHKAPAFERADGRLMIDKAGEDSRALLNRN